VPELVLVYHEIIAIIAHSIFGTCTHLEADDSLSPELDITTNENCVNDYIGVLCDAHLYLNLELWDPEKALQHRKVKNTTFATLVASSLRGTFIFYFIF